MSDPLSIAMTCMKTHQVWKDYTDYTSLRFEVQNMMLYCQVVGGPFIVTNDPMYMPYVYADAVQRVPVGIAKLPPTGTLDG